MAPNAPRVRKRNRKRKRRNVSVSSSSSSSSGDESPHVVPSPSKAPPPAMTDGSDSDSDASSSTSSTSSTHSSRPAEPTEGTKLDSLKQVPRRPPSRSPSPPDTTLPALIPTNPSTGAEEIKEKVLKEKFRKFWMASIADGFKDDLEQIRKEPNMSTSRLSMLIDALASGADVFSSVLPSGSRNQVNEMEVVLGSSESSL